MRAAVWFVWVLLLAFGRFNLSGQGTLQFNKAMILTSDSGQKIVPANKVWKVESYTYNSNFRYVAYANWGNVNWNASNPNPCTGATSGTSNINYYSVGNCPSANANFFVNGNRAGSTTFNSFPLWLPAGINVLVSSNVCYSTVSFSVPANTPVRDDNTNAYLCGPINVTAGPVPNSPVVSILEFNIIP
jgi:hypothetical protein